MPPRRKRRRTSIDLALQLMATRRRHAERLRRIVASRALRALGIACLCGAALAAAWWLLAPSLVVRTAFKAAARGDVETVALLADTEDIAAAFFDEWAAVTSLRADGTPRAVSLSVKPEAVRHLLQLARTEMDRALFGRSEFFRDVRVQTDLTFGARAVQDIPVRVSAGDVQVQFHARVARQGLVWRITELPGSVAALAQILDR